MEYTRGLHPFLETLGLIYLTKNFEAVKADMLRSLDEMNMDGNQFYKQYLSYLDHYVRVFAESCSISEEESFFFGNNTEFFLTVLAMAAELFESEPELDQLEQQQILSVMTTFLAEEKKEEIPNINSLENWFLLLQSLEYSEDTKWRLLELISNPVKKFIEGIVLLLILPFRKIERFWKNWFLKRHRIFQMSCATLYLNFILKPKRSI